MTSNPARRNLKGIPEIRNFFRTNQTPVFSVGPTAFNLLGIDRFVRNFSYIAYYDSWDGAHPRVFSPRNKPYVDFQSTEEINCYLLRDPEVQGYLRRFGGDRPKIAMVFFGGQFSHGLRDRLAEFLFVGIVNRREDGRRLGAVSLVILFSRDPAPQPIHGSVMG